MSAVVATIVAAFDDRVSTMLRLFAVALAAIAPGVWWWRRSRRRARITEAEPAAGDVAGLPVDEEPDHDLGWLVGRIDAVAEDGEPSEVAVPTTLARTLWGPAGAADPVARAVLGDALRRGRVRAEPPELGDAAAETVVVVLRPAEATR